jgi:putative ABC transport system ATP-binding protein
MREYQIECISLSKRYNRNKENFTGVENINLCIRQNETVLIKGRSGAGKSTLLNLMCGLINPSQGKIFIGNHCITELSDDALSQVLLNEIGIIFQNFNLLPTYTIYENIEIAIVPKKLNPKLVKEQIMFFLEEFNLKNKAFQLPTELSIGQQQKVAIIRTLIKQPTIIFADEPTGSVDNETAAEILEHLSNLKKENQKTLVLASHGNIPDSFADTLYSLENGIIHSLKN